MTTITVNSINVNFPQSGYSRARMIGVSAIRLLNAGVMANDSQACANRAREIYSRPSGMWAKVRADARRLLRNAEAHGVTLERPYWIETNGDYKTLMILSSDGSGLPLKSLRVKS